MIMHFSHSGNSICSISKYLLLLLLDTKEAILQLVQSGVCHSYGQVIIITGDFSVWVW